MIRVLISRDTSVNLAWLQFSLQNFFPLNTLFDFNKQYTSVWNLEPCTTRTNTVSQLQGIFVTKNDFEIQLTVLCIWSDFKIFGIFFYLKIDGIMTYFSYACTCSNQYLVKQSTNINYFNLLLIAYVWMRLRNNKIK